MVAHTCNPSIKQVEARELQVQGQLGLHTEILSQERTVPKWHFCGDVCQTEQNSVTAKIILFPGLVMTAPPASSVRVLPQETHPCIYQSVCRLRDASVRPRSMKPWGSIFRSDPRDRDSSTFSLVNFWKWCRAYNPNEVAECRVINARELVKTAAPWDFMGGSHFRVSHFNPSPYVCPKLREPGERG